MNTLDKARTEGWRILVGKLAKGFFVEVHDCGMEKHILGLFYKGKRAKRIIQPGGYNSKGKRAHIACFDIPAECSYEEKQKIVKEIREKTEEVLKTIKK